MNGLKSSIAGSKALWLAALLAALLPQVSSAESTANQPAIDVMLDAHGSMYGRVVDSSGNGLAQREIQVFSRTVGFTAKAVSNADGWFRVDGLSGGFYYVNADNAGGLVRVWTQQAAPPVAHQAVQLISRETVVRGVFESMTPAERMGIVLGTTGTTLGIIALATHTKSAS